VAQGWAIIVVAKHEIRQDEGLALGVSFCAMATYRKMQFWYASCLIKMQK
jgi:hypothetical protein